MKQVSTIKKIMTVVLFFVVSMNSVTAHGLAAITFSDIVIPEAPPVASVMVAYMQIKNNTDNVKVISKISSPQFQRVEIHEMTMANGMMDMKQLKSLPIKANQTVILKSGGLHVMLIQPLKPLKHNDKVELTFKFSSGELTTINTRVQKTDLTQSHHH